ncbi:hypothetical protein KCU95_g120, partial [Aureobasidium melanogenum]
MFHRVVHRDIRCVRIILIHTILSIMLHCSGVSNQFGAHEVPFLKASKPFCRSDRLVSSLFVKKSPMVPLLTLLCCVSLRDEKNTYPRSKKNLMFVQDFTLIKMFEAFDKNLEMGVDMLDALGPYGISSELDRSCVDSSSNLKAIEPLVQEILACSTPMQRNVGEILDRWVCQIFRWTR